MAGPYRDPAIAQGFQNIADIFAPPSAQEIYAGARAVGERQKAQRLADMWAMRDNPDQATRDRAGIAAGLYKPNQSYYAVDADTTTKRRGQDVESGDRRYHTDTEAGTSRANNTADNTRAMNVAMVAPVAEGATRFVPPDIASMFNVAPTQTGVVKLNPGQNATMPAGPAGAGSLADAGVPAPTVLQGNPKPLTTDEVAAATLQGMPQDAREGVATEKMKLEDVIMGDGSRKPMTSAQRLATGSPAAPKETATGQYFEYTLPGNIKGTAKHDPVSGRLVDQATGEPVPGTAQLRQVSGAGTTINVGPNGETFGAPPKDMAWAREADGKTVKVDERGAPVAVKIGGTPLDIKEQQTADKKIEMETQRRASSDVVTQDIDRAIAAVQADPSSTTGLGGQLTQSIGGTPAKNVQGLIASVKANVAFDRLQQMRQSSPTGGALGNVSDKEGELLQSSLGSLDQAQDGKQFIENLKRVKDISLDIIHGGKTNGKPTAGPARSYEPTATNPQTKERQVLRGGQWVPE